MVVVSRVMDGVGVEYLCHLIACWMVLDKAVGTYSI